MQTPLQVDATALILTGLRAQLGIGVRCVTEFPADLEQALPIVRVELAGGGDDGVLLDSPTVTLDCIAEGTEGSRQFAYQVIGGMYALRGQVINGAAISYVNKISGPIPLSYENPAVRTAGSLTFRVSVLAHLTTQHHPVSAATGQPLAPNVGAG
jgi:hypothetical protein